MDDLISRNKLQQNRPEWLNENCVGREEHNKGWNACNEMWLKTIAEQPTVEAVPVVRCKKCEHWGTGGAGETKHVKCCEYAKYMVGENGYCCYGADMRTSAE